MEGRGPGSRKRTKQYGMGAIGRAPNNAREDSDTATKAIPEGQARADLPLYALYDKVHRPDLLAFAYALTGANGGAPGVDAVGHEGLEEGGRERFLEELRCELQEKRYKPDAVLRVMIPKASGGERPLGIPTVKDRTASGWRGLLHLGRRKRSHRSRPASFNMPRSMGTPVDNAVVELGSLAACLDTSRQATQGSDCTGAFGGRVDTCLQRRHNRRESS